MVSGYKYELIYENTGVPGSSSFVVNAKMDDAYVKFMAREQQIRNEAVILALQSETATRVKVV